ncbi:hypothetical protein BDV10DRAFT_106972 [Aspergillus recurvatus]
MTGHRSCVQMLALPCWDRSYSQTLSCTRQGSPKADSKCQTRRRHPNSNFDVSRQPRVHWFWPLFRPSLDSAVFHRAQQTGGNKKVCLFLLIYISSAYSFGCPMATRAATLVFPNKEYNRGAGYRSFSPSRLGSIRSTCPCNKLVLGF